MAATNDLFNRDYHCNPTGSVFRSILFSVSISLSLFVPLHTSVSQEMEPISYFKNLPGIMISDLSALPNDALAPEGRPALILGLAAAVAGPLIVDEEIRNLIQPPSNKIRHYLIRPFRFDSLVGGLHSGAFGLLGLGWISGKEEIARWGGALTETVLLLDVIVFSAKVITGRSRPQIGSAHDFSPPGSINDAFPSGHTAFGFGLAGLVSRSSAPGWTKILLWAGGSGIALQRIFSDEHWTSDVVIGALLGIWAGRRVAERYWGDSIRNVENRIRSPERQFNHAKQYSLKIIPYFRRDCYFLTALFGFVSD